MTDQGYTIDRTDRTADGGRLRATLQISTVDGSKYLTVNHGKAPYPFLRVSITGEYAPKGVRFGTNASAYGQCHEYAGPRLRELWERWHLNDRRAACAHMNGLPVDTSYDVRRGYACEDGSGYVYGTAWLVEPLTHAGALDLLRFFHAPDDLAVISRDGVAVAVTDNVLRTMHDLQGQSVQYAVTHGGYVIETVAGDTVDV